MLVLAHRGLHSDAAPENTLRAFEQAVAAGADGIETDLRLSRDGIPVLFHDRLTADGREVADLTAAELSAAAGYPVPTLDEALAAWPGILWNLEIKAPAALGATLSRVRRLAGRSFLVSSFWHPLVEPFTGIPGVECALLLATRPATLEAFAGLFPRDGRIRSVVWSWETLDPVLLDQAEAIGFRSWVYGLESDPDHRLAAELGLAGVITDTPEVLIGQTRTRS